MGNNKLPQPPTRAEVISRMADELLTIARRPILEEYERAIFKGYLYVTNAEGGPEIVKFVGPNFGSTLHLKDQAIHNATRLRELGDRASSKNSAAEKGYLPGAFRATDDWIYSFCGFPGFYWNEVLMVMLAYKQGGTNLSEIIQETSPETVERLDRLVAYYVQR